MLGKFYRSQSRNGLALRAEIEKAQYMCTKSAARGLLPMLWSIAQKNKQSLVSYEQALTSIEVQVAKMLDEKIGERLLGYIYLRGLNSQYDDFRRQLAIDGKHDLPFSELRVLVLQYASAVHLKTGKNFFFLYPAMVLFATIFFILMCTFAQAMPWTPNSKRRTRSPRIISPKLGLFVGVAVAASAAVAVAGDVAVAAAEAAVDAGEARTGASSPSPKRRSGLVRLFLVLSIVAKSHLLSANASHVGAWDASPISSSAPLVRPPSSLERLALPSAAGPGSY